MRINKYLAHSGYCSRRQADQLIAEGRVLVNGKPADLGQTVDPQIDRIQVGTDTIELITPDNYVYLALNKPQGITCTTDPRRRDNIIDYLGFPERIYPIGRLDRDSEGLILLTNDGDIVNKILRAQNHHDKEYYVEVDRPYDATFVEQMQTGVHILGQVTLPAQLRPVSPTGFRLIIHQGLNRQIRRMTETLGYQVTYLKRLRILNIDMGSLPLGSYRELTYKEVRDLKELLDR